jgi:hypothetical protein
MFMNPPAENLSQADGSGLDVMAEVSNSETGKPRSGKEKYADYEGSE